jgi:hypothetical protein
MRSQSSMPLRPNASPMRPYNGAAIVAASRYAVTNGRKGGLGREGAR